MFFVANDGVVDAVTAGVVTAVEIVTAVVVVGFAAAVDVAVADCKDLIQSYRVACWCLAAAVHIPPV